MNGFKVCRTLRAEGNWTPILVLTAKSGEYDEAEALDTGADDFLSKPFSFVVLVARLRALAPPGQHAAAADARGGHARRSTPTPGPRIARARRCTSRPASSPCWRRCCGARAGWPPSRSCSTRSGAPTSRGDPNIVEVYVRYLRKKVDVPFGLDTIETVGRSATGWCPMSERPTGAVRAWPWRSVRLRITLVATALVGVTLALAAWALVSLVERQLTDQAARGRDPGPRHHRGRVPARASRSAWSAWRRSVGPGCR